MKKIICALFFMCICQIFAQNTYLNQVLLLNEGCYDYYEQEILEPVTVGVYNPDTNTYNTIIEISGARFASDLIIDQDAYYTTQGTNPGTSVGDLSACRDAFKRYEEATDGEYTTDPQFLPENKRFV